MSFAALVAAAAIVLPTGPGDGTVTRQYCGLLYGRRQALVQLISGTGLSAVWLGASTPNASNWVQAGVTTGNQLYIERGLDGAQVAIRFWPAPLTGVRVRLEHADGHWRVLAGGHHSSWVRLRHGGSIATVETTGQALAAINGRLISCG